MNQILHIFRKDTRRFWPEILLSVIVTFAFVCVYPNEWRIFHDPSVRMRSLQFVSILGVLMLVAWWLLTARVIHAETLVGDQQFWITRPYEWGKLLAAKVLFLAVWLGIVYLLAQSYLLVEAGYHPLSYIPSLLYGLLLIVIVIVLPVFALAAVTSTFARLTLTMLGGFILLFGYMFWVNVPHGYTPSHPYTNVVLYPLLFAGCIAAIVLQYSTRRTWQSRTVLIVLPVLLALSVSAYHRSSLVDRAYAQSAPGVSAPVNVSFSPRPVTPLQARSWEGEDYIDLPLRFADVADGHAVFVDDYKFTITAGDGSQWSSPWQADEEDILPGGHPRELHLMIKPDLYDRFKSGPVTLRVVFAVSRYQANSVINMGFPAAGAPIPGIGFCAPQFYQAPNLYCRAATEPPLTYVTAQWSKSDCSDSAHLFEPGAGSAMWIRPSGIDLSLASVWNRNLYLQYNETDEERKEHSHWHLCPGSPLTVTQYHLLNRTQAETTLANFVLPAYVQPT